MENQSPRQKHPGVLKRSQIKQMRYTTGSILIATTVCAIGLHMWLASIPSFVWVQGISYGTSTECQTYSQAQSAIDEWLLTQGFVTMSDPLPYSATDKPNSHRFGCKKNRFVFVETFSDSKSFGANIVVYAKDSPVAMRAIKKELKMESDKLEKNMKDWWDSWIVDHPFQFEKAN